MTTFRVETLLASLKEIQQEKIRLEEKLNERRDTRRQLEQELESVNGKYLQVKDLHTKMKETLKIAQHKVSQTQCLLDSLEERNQYINNNITDLNRQVDEEKNLQMDEVREFEKNLSEVSDHLFSARTMYTDENLQNSLTELETVEKELNEKYNNYQNSIRGMESDLENLKLNPVQEPSYSDIPVELRKDLWTFFQDEHQKANECLQEIQEQIENTKQKLEVFY